MASNKLLGKIVSLAIGAYFLAYIFVDAVVAYAGANTSGMSTAELALYGVIGIVILLAVVVTILKEVGVTI